MMLWFVALPLTTLAEITALGFTGPIFVTIGAALFLSEKVRLRRWIAVIVGFIGAMIIIRPGFGDIHLGVICILISTPIFSASNLISKALARTDSATTIVIWQNIVIVICAFPVALWFWQTPTLVDIFWFLLAGAAGTLGHICQQRGYQLADITLLQPIGFLSLIWNTMLGYFLFFQKPDVWTFVGAAVIFASALYISHREAVRRAQIKTATAKANPRREPQPPVTLMWRGTAGPLWRRSMMKSWPLGLRAIASVMARSSTSSLSEARSGPRKSAASSWPRHI